jgi:hypothetical protein
LSVEASDKRRLTAATVAGQALINVSAGNAVTGVTAGARTTSARADSVCANSASEAATVVGLTLVDVVAAPLTTETISAEASRAIRAIVTASVVDAGGAGITVIGSQALVDILAGGKTSANEAVRAGRAGPGARSVDALSTTVASTVVDNTFVDISAGNAIASETRLALAGVGATVGGIGIKRVEVSAHGIGRANSQMAFVDVDANLSIGEGRVASGASGARTASSGGLTVVGNGSAVVVKAQTIGAAVGEHTANVGGIAIKVEARRASVTSTTALGVTANDGGRASTVIGEALIDVRASDTISGKAGAVA